MQDRLARMLEEVGLPHTISRVFVALALAEGEGLSTGELVEGLGVSKASVSNATQFLLGVELIERYRVRNSRETHYRILTDVWGPVLAKKFAAIGYVRETVEQALRLEPSDEARRRLLEMHDAYSFFETEFKDAMLRWNERETA